jgi:hypothetical protein
MKYPGKGFPAGPYLPQYKKDRSAAYEQGAAN